MTPIRVQDLMSSQVVAVRPTDDIATLHRLMMEHDIRHIPVVDDDQELVGLVSHRDLLRVSLIEQPEVPLSVEEALRERIRVSEVMTEGVETIAPDADLRDAADTMVENKYGCLPVTDGRRLVGILTESDFVRLMAGGEG